MFSTFASAFALGLFALLVFGLSRVWVYINRQRVRMDQTEKAIDRAARDLAEKNARGTRRTHGEI